MVALLITTLGLALAAPFRSPPVRKIELEPRPGQRADRLIVKLNEGMGLRYEKGAFNGQSGDVLHGLLADAKPLFSRSSVALEQDRLALNSGLELADLSLYLRIDADDAVDRGNALLLDPRIETVYLAPQPPPPPFDIPPETPSFVDQQYHLDAGPDGMGFDISDRWVGADGALIAIADIEYGFDPTHEMFHQMDIDTLGYETGWYQSHGNGVLGILAPPDTGYGVLGMTPSARYLMVSPFISEDVYSVADAINLAASEMIAGDILLIEQQGWIDDIFTPVEVDPAVFDAISIAVAQGIVVIEPAGNGGCDLDDPMWNGWFNRDERDSGAIIVGGGASPLSGYPPRTWFPGGSCYGERVDVQAWYDSIVTASAEDGAPRFSDLFYPNADGRQAYTAQFGGTSGASPMVAAIAAAVNGVLIEQRGEPMAPMDLRAAMISTGHPQPEEDVYRIGPQPDLRRLLRIWGVR